MGFCQICMSEHCFRAETSGQSRSLGWNDCRLVAALRRLLRFRRLHRELVFRFLKLNYGSVRVPRFLALVVACFWTLLFKKIVSLFLTFSTTIVDNNIPSYEKVALLKKFLLRFLPFVYIAFIRSLRQSRNIKETTDILGHVTLTLSYSRQFSKIISLFGYHI